MSTMLRQQRIGGDRRTACLLGWILAAALGACARGDTSADTGTLGGMVGDTTTPPAATATVQAADSTTPQPTATPAAATPAVPSQAAATKPVAKSVQPSTPAPAKPAAPRRNDTAAARSAAAGASTTPTAAPTSAASPSASAGGADSLLVSQDEYNGWKTYHVYCYRCHGVEAMGSDIAPNLRESLRTHITHDLFIETVTNGRLDKGMPAWKELLTKDKMDEVYAYLKARSDGRLKPGRPHTAAKE